MNRLKFVLPIALATFTLACAPPAAVPAAKRLVDVVGPVVAAAAPATAATRSLLTYDPYYPGGYDPFFPLGMPPLPPAPEMVRVPYELNRLDHIDISIKTPQASEFTPVGRLDHYGIGDADHSFPNVTLANLQPYQLYEVRLRAFQVDPGRGNSLVEVTAGSAAQGADVENLWESTTVFTTNAIGNNGYQLPVTNGANEQVFVPGFRLKLADQLFQGRSNGNIAATNGSLSGNGLPVTLDQNQYPD